LNENVKSGNASSIAAKILPFEKKQQERKRIEDDEKHKGNKTPTNKVIKSKNLLGNMDPLDLKPKITKAVSKVSNIASVRTVKKVKRK
jgi:hypothetical protein